MHWYGGSIAEAVKLSKQKNAIFVVFVEGDNDLSKELADTIDNESVLSRLDNQDKFLAIKLKSGTDNYTYFAQIYQFVPVPSLFFIGRNGAPLEVVCAGIDSQNLAARIDLIMDEHHKEDTPSVRPSTSAQSVKEKTQNLIQMESNIEIPKPSTQSKAPVPMSPDESNTEDAGPAAKVQKTEHHGSQGYEVVCDGDVCVRKPKSDQASTSQAMDTQVPSSEPAPSSPNSEASAAEKLEKVNMLLELKRREKAEKEKELEKQKELERRSVGQGVAELRRWQADQELKQVQEERKREKMENALARQRILDQIAQDRAERRARDQPAPAPAPASTPAPASAPHREPDVAATGGDAAGGVARLQLKLPDGGTHLVQLPADAPLQRVHEYIERDLQLPWSQLSLWTAFPRRELADGEASLRALGLAPSAALLLLPRPARAAAVQPPAASLFAFLTQLFTSMVLEPSYQVYYWIRDRLFPRGGASREGGRSPSPGGARRPPSPPGGARRPPSPGGVRRRQGTVHRLGSAADDDNNTWNGNSTQQM